MEEWDRARPKGECDVCYCTNSGRKADIILGPLSADTVEKLICCGGWSLLIHSTENESGGSVDDGRSAGDTGEPILSVSVGRPGSRRSHAACHRPLPRPRWVEAASGAVLQHDGPALD